MKTLNCESNITLFLNFYSYSESNCKHKHQNTCFCWQSSQLILQIFGKFLLNTSLNRTLRPNKEMEAIAGSDNSSDNSQKEKVTQKPLIQNSSLWINSCESDPMGIRFRIASTDFLDEISDRSLCKGCHKSRKYYCYTCHLALDVIRSRVPTITLPVKIDIIKHIQEVDGKSTSSQAAIIAPEDCRIYTFPQIPDWTDQRVIQRLTYVYINDLWLQSNHYTLTSIDR